MNPADSFESIPALHGITVERVLAAQPHPAWICTGGTMEVLAANRAADRHLGGAVSGIAGHRLIEATQIPSGGRALSAWAEDHGEAGPVWPLRRADGTTVATRVVVTPLEAEANPRVLVSALGDREPRAGVAPRRSEDELLRDAKRESLELLAGGVAHDFNNLLTALLGNLSLARMDTEAEASVQEWLEEAEKAAARARDLTQQLLTFAKGGEPVRRLTDLGSCVREAARFARQGSRVRCEFAVAADLWPAEVDAGQIGQVVHNLVLNAVQAMPGGGVISVSARNVHREMARQMSLGPHHFVVVEVRDEGPGIRPEDMARIFQPYFTTKSAGSGLGLATSQTIARRHFGALRVESEPGRGAAFLLYLPARPGAVLEPSGAERQVTPMNGRILFMDDEPSILQMAPNLLSRLGFESEVVTDGGAAIEAYREALATGRRFDAVILDLTVPAGMGGVEAARRLREIDPTVCVLVSSGYADDPVLLDHRPHGFCGTVVKPYCLADLAEVLGRVLRRDPTNA